MSYGSLKETKYLLYFSKREGYLAESEYKEIISISEELGAMLWTTIKGIQNQL